jgi:splicing factor U2AF subunit
VGACRHGEHCNRIHNKPMISQTIMFKHLYQNPPAAIAFAEGSKVNDDDLKDALKHFEQFYEEIFVELSKYGELKELCVVDNLGDHLIGNVYARFNDESSASKAFNALAGKYYHSQLVEEEYCPIINIRDCRCKKYAQGICKRGAFCNFLHLKEVNRELIRSLKEEMYENHPEYKRNRINNFNRKRERNHEHSSSDSSLDIYDGPSRKRIIQRWNVKYQIEKKEEEKRKRNRQTKIDLAIIEQKLTMGKRFDEDEKRNNGYKIIRKDRERERRYNQSDDEETISKGDL